MSVDPQTLKARVTATFELIDGVVRIDYVDENAESSWSEYLPGLVHNKKYRLVKPSEGETHWALLDITFSQSTFVYVDVEPP